MLQSILIAPQYANCSPHESATAKNKVLLTATLSFNIFQHFNPLLLILMRCREAPKKSIKPVHSPPAPSTLWCCSRVALGTKICHVGFAGAVSDGFSSEFPGCFSCLSFLWSSSWRKKTTWRGATFFPTWHSAWCTWPMAISCKVMRKDQRFLDCQQKNLSTS